MTNDSLLATRQPEYIAYPKAMRLLSERLGATPEELAAWLFWGPELGGLTAYLNANELSPPRRFDFAYSLLSNSADYIEPLMACWFSEEDVASFHPKERYITGKALIERWRLYADIKPEAFIQAKIRESRLMDVHPIHGVTEGSGLGLGSTQPLETGLFALSEIEEIEASDFGVVQPDSLQPLKHSGHLNYDPEMQKRANEIATEIIAATSRVPTKDKVANKLSAEIEVPIDTVLRRIRVEWKKKPFAKRRK